MLELLKIRPLSPSGLKPHLKISRENIYKFYIKPLLEQGKIKKVEGTKMYQIAEQNNTKRTILEELYSNSEIMNTQLMKNWKQNNNAKKEPERFTTFANLCLGIVNPKFKMHPDSLTRESWEPIIKNAVAAIKEAKGITKLGWSDKQMLRHAVMYGLEIEIPTAKAEKLGIDGIKDQPRVNALHISKERYEQCKNILKKSQRKELLPKFGFKISTFVRPSIVYTVKTDDPIFYDRTVKYVEIDNERITSKKIIDFIDKLLIIFPQATEKIKIGTYTHRACRLVVHEHKTDADFNKFIYDEEFVIALENWVKQRKFQKKKYLFWDDNSTVFTFENYDKILRNKVNNENKVWKTLFKKVGFQQEDFGIAFRANYGFRHMGLQMWLEATDYDYEFVSEMSHDDVATLKKWYGKRRAEHLEQKASEVIF